MDEHVNEKEEKKEPFSLQKEIFEWVYTIVIALAIAFLVKGFLFDIVQVDGPSMLPTLVDGDRLVITKLGYHPKAGDIVILDSTYEKRQHYYNTLASQQGKNASALFKMTNYFSLPKDLKIRYYVKRVIATEGQTIDFEDGKVLVDGAVLDEPYYDGETTPMDASVDFPMTVEEGHVFVMGDNRPHSKDSRDSSLGAVPEKAVVGKSQFRIWPPKSIGATK